MPRCVIQNVGRSYIYGLPPIPWEWYTELWQNTTGFVFCHNHVDCSARHFYVTDGHENNEMTRRYEIMRRRFLVTMMALAMAFSLTACGGKKDDTETTATTEAASEVKDELIQFVGTDIPKVETEEAEIMTKYNAYFAEGTTIDTDALLKDLTDNLLPKYKTFLSDIEAISLKTDEVKDLRDKYFDAMNTQYQALQKVETAIKDKDKDVQTEAQKLLSDAQSKYTAYNDAVYALAQQENVTLKGEMATTATTEAGSTTEANTEAIDPNEELVDDTATSETDTAADSDTEADAE